jgi:hypothetical protein
MKHWYYVTNPWSLFLPSQKLARFPLGTILAGPDLQIMFHASSACHSWQTGGEIIAQAGNGFQGHVAARCGASNGAPGEDAGKRVQG